MVALLWPSLGALLGLVAGSFLATLVIRWPEGQPLSGRSRCDSCGAGVAWADLVPLLGWLALKGRCRACGAAIDPRHPLFEIMAAAIGLLAMLAVPGPQGLWGAVLGWVLLALLALDLQHYWLPDRLTLPLLALGLAGGMGTLPERLLGAATGGGGLLLLALLYRWLRGREGLGLGDVKLMAALGAWLSLGLLGPLLLAASVAGLAFAAVSRWRRTAEDGAVMRVPFGACLALAGFPMWLAANAAGGG
jgi:leader peptidase (prepilin peptidase)/N-methyltransferase